MQIDGRGDPIDGRGDRPLNPITLQLPLSSQSSSSMHRAIPPSDPAGNAAIPTDTPAASPTPIPTPIPTDATPPAASRPSVVQTDDLAASLSQVSPQPMRRPHVRRLSANDVPEAVRDSATLPTPQSARKTSSWGWLTGGVLGAIALAAAAIGYGNLMGWDWTQLLIPPSTSIAEPPATSESTDPNAVDPATDPNPDPNTVLGHRPYDEAPRSDLKPITADGRIQLRTAAADRYLAMEAAARADGVILAVISGFRSVEDQQSIFFEVKAQRNQDTSQRAEVSAPPGYSEHHTGYAIDLGDANVPATHLSPQFENTAAFRWLEEHAARFNFELSFTRANAQGIAYEPWHWRYVGDRHSLETFYKGSRGQASPSETDPDLSPNSATGDSDAIEGNRPTDEDLENRP